MTIEKLLEAQTAAIIANTAAVNANTEGVNVLIAGREEALAKLTENGSAAAAKPARKPRQTKADKEAAEAAEKEAAKEHESKTATAAAEASEKASAKADKAWNPDITDDGIKKIVGEYNKGLADDEARGEFISFLKEIATNFSQEKLLDITAADERTQAVFFLIRHTEGLTVDFSADYEFDQDPLTQGDLEPAAAADSADPMDNI